MTGAGDLRSRLVFASRVLTGDGAGNQQATWVDRLTCAAEVKPSRGSEVVDADRLQGRGLVTIRVRNTSATRQITADWMATDVRSGLEYNIRSAFDPDLGRPMHGKWVELVAEHGRAVG